MIDRVCLKFTPRLAGMATLMASMMSGPVCGQLADGFAELQQRLGGSSPTGAGVGLGMGEALAGTNYAPGSSTAQVLLMSGPSGNSAHAQMVANTYVQRCPSVATIWSWEALDFLQSGLLNFGAGQPLMPPAGLDLFNHSWIASGEDAASGNQALRRFDFQVVRDGTLSMVGIGNNASAPPVYLMSSQYNGITVGANNTSHGNTPGGGRDGQGRMKPDIAVQSVGASSTATPIATAVAAILLETAATDPLLLSNPDAADEQVTKSVMLASAVRADGWSNEPSEVGDTRGRTARPFDPLWGAGFVDANRAHLVLTGGEQDSAATVPVEANASSRGWSRVSINSGASRYWRFSIGEAVDEVAILATWPRIVASNFASWSLMNIDLTLHRVAGTTLVPLTGDDGIPYFASGNVVSESSVDNVELLVVRDLAPGDYVFEIYRHVGATSTPVAVAWIMPETEPQGPVGDINGDGIVDGADLGLLLIDWGTCSPKGPCDGDLNGDGEVNGADLGLLLQNWG